MPLTPTDVANKQFRIAFRGYSLDEVDAFLDEVETELSRLLRDNAGLKDRPAGAAAAATATAPAPAPLAGMEGQEAALRTLLLAQRTADEAIAEARAEAEQIVIAARSEADSIVAPARSEADSTLGAARTEAETTLTGARTEAESTLGTARAEAESTLTAARTEAKTTLDAARAEATTTLGKARSEAESTLAKAKAEAERTLSAAQAKAAGVEAEVAQRIQAATGDLDEQRTALETRIEELRAFEREYRTRLKAYLETQLRDLDSRQAPDDGGVGVPAGARAAAVGLTPGGAAGVRRGGGKEQAPADAPSVRAVPPLAASGAEPVGPFAPAPGTPPAER